MLTFCNISNLRMRILKQHAGLVKAKSSAVLLEIILQQMRTMSKLFETFWPSLAKPLQDELHWDFWARARIWSKQKSSWILGDNHMIFLCSMQINLRLKKIVVATPFASCHLLTRGNIMWLMSKNARYSFQSFFPLSSALNVSWVILSWSSAVVLPHMRLQFVRLFPLLAQGAKHWLSTKHRHPVCSENLQGLGVCSCLNAGEERL